jgi:hypothetical protein
VLVPLSSAAGVAGACDESWAFDAGARNDERLKARNTFASSLIHAFVRTIHSIPSVTGLGTNAIPLVAEVDDR